MRKDSIWSRKGLSALLAFSSFFLFVCVWFHFTRGEGAGRVVPTPLEVYSGYVSELLNGRMPRDTLVSLRRIAFGFGISVATAVPLGIFLGSHAFFSAMTTAFLNFFRGLSPIAWIPFAVLWFGIGDLPVVFLLVMGSFFSIVLSVSAAVRGVPPIYVQMAKEDGLSDLRIRSRVLFPAVFPEILMVLRIAWGLSWSVVVAAEMLAGSEGLGFAIMDARNGLRNDLLVANMIQIGLIGVVIDQAFVRLMKWKRVRWKYG